jgi:MFS family permease
LYLSVIIVAFSEGGLFVLAGIIAHEDYGSKKYTKILGIFMTGAAVGILIFEKLVFDYLYNMMATYEDNQNYASYGKWNKYIFMVTVLSSFLAFIMSLGAFLRTRKND